MKKHVAMREALGAPELLADALRGDSWHAWRVLLIAAMGEALTEAERPIYAKLTGGRDHEPGEMVDEPAWVALRKFHSIPSAIKIGAFSSWAESEVGGFSR